MFSESTRQYFWEAMGRLLGALGGAILGLLIGGVICLLTGDGWQFGPDFWGDPAMLIFSIVFLSAVGATFPKSIWYTIGKIVEHVNLPN